VIWCVLTTLVLMIAGSIITYVDEYRRAGWYAPVFVAISAGNAVAFAVACKLLDAKNSIFVLSLALDGIMLFAYYLLPLLALGVRPSAAVLIGAALVVAGFVVIKLGGPT